MYLFETSELADRLGISLDVEDFRLAMEAASRSATRDAAARLNYGSFDEYSRRRDVFVVTRVFGNHPGQHVDFQLSRGFVLEDSVTARYTSSPVNWRNGDADLLTDVSDVGEDGRSDHLAVQAEIGLVTAYQLDLKDLWVVVDYDGGLDVDSNGIYQGVPGWLHEFALSSAIVHLMQNRALFEDANADVNSPQLRAALTSIQRERRRYAGAAMKPRWTGTTPL